MGRSLFGLLVLSMCVLVEPLQGQAPVHHAPRGSLGPAVLVPLDQIEWTPIFPGAQGAEIAIVHVDPETKATQLYFRLAPRGQSPRHWHSANETIVVVRGTFIVQHEGGERHTMAPGDFALMPKRMVHQAWTGDEETIVFVSLDGAWDFNVVPGSTPAPPKK